MEPGFEPVREAFEANFRERGELGAAFCVIHRGRRVVDLHGGWADRASRRPWEADTLGTIFSSTKGLAATCFLMLADRGDLDYDTPLGDIWPEMGRAGRGDITVRTLLNHRAGLCAIDAPLSLDDLEDPERTEAALVAQVPLWEPGTGQGYHGVSFGPYASAVFRRLAGKSLGTFLAQEVAGPLGADVHLGLPEALDDRVATLYPVGVGERLFRGVPWVVRYPRSVERRLIRALMRPASLTARAFASPAALGQKGLKNFNLPRVRRMELAWANGIASARGLARVYSALSARGAVDGVQLCRPETLHPVYGRQSFEMDKVILKPLGWSQGFIKEQPHLFSPAPEAFGHPGAGGPLGFADPTRELAFGYVMNRMDFRLRSPRCLALCHAVYRALDVPIPAAPH